jgi:hypothetical protein
MKKHLLMSLLAGLLPLFLLAQEKAPALNADRPNETQSPVVVPRGSWQLEAGLAYRQEDLGDSRRRELLYPEVLLRMGLLKWAELRLQAAYKEERRKWQGSADFYNPKGLEHLQVGAKAQVYPGQGVVPEIGVLALFTLPVGHQAFRPPHVAPEGRLLFNNKIFDKLELQYNVGYRKQRDQDEYQGEVLYALSGNLKLLDTFTWFTEFYATKAKGEAAQNTLQVGLQVLLQANLQWDLLSGFRLPEKMFSDAGENFFVGTGLSWRLPQ